ncbi:type II toxin-antitoxin system Phd/YefM family antitoxin [Thiocystis violacea]|uniref:type II toxin-antitoxin system Phd/YefM family antitoxin n=1 Tax=Thiocystis violacea TaxID=13725 RepID=UPI001908AC69|nr:type II toxin-antitoxin system Phd/YefM family antitoxin [Thiocystis violacea]MBK1717129.1 prevent-host-death protein [Thiocystis violacea]
MDTVTVNHFRDNLRAHVEKVISDHEPLKVSRRNGADFIVLSAEDWEREQETLYVLQTPALMTQIAQSLQTHATASGYRPTREQLDALDRL